MWNFYRSKTALRTKLDILSVNGVEGRICIPAINLHPLGC
jgi:hypothetical protein